MVMSVWMLFIRIHIWRGETFIVRLRGSVNAYFTTHEKIEGVYITLGTQDNL